MFQFTQEPSSVSQIQCLTKITVMVTLCLSIRALSVLWRHISTCCACVWFAAQRMTFLWGRTEWRKTQVCFVRSGGFRILSTDL